MIDFELRSFVCEPLRGEIVVFGYLVSFPTWFAQHLHYISVIYFIKKVLKVTTIFLFPPHIFAIQSMLTNYLFPETLMTYNFLQFISLILEISTIKLSTRLISFKLGTCIFLRGSILVSLFFHK